MRDLHVPFLDLSIAQSPLEDSLTEAWRTVVRSARYVGGPFVDAFEAAWAEACHVDHAIGVGNGTDAIELALRGLGIGTGDEVLVPDNTFIATAEAVVAVGATPVFVDVDPDTLLVTAEGAREGLGPRTAALIVVHLYGQAADMTALNEVGRTAGIAVVEDCAQAHGARWRGEPVGGLGTVGAASFYPGKNLGAFGDGGAVTTDDDELARRVRQLADHGRSETSKYEHPVVGRNSRLDAVQAAVLGVKLPHLASWNALRSSAADHYRRRLSGRDGIVLTRQHSDGTPVHHLEVVRVRDRDRVRGLLHDSAVETGVHYPVPCHRQPGYGSFPTTDLRVTGAAAPQLLSLPMFPGITAAQVDRVCDVLIGAVV